MIHADESSGLTDDLELETTVQEALKDAGFRDFLRRTGSDLTVLKEWEILEHSEKSEKETQPPISPVLQPKQTESVVSREYLTFKSAVEGLRNQDTVGYKERHYTIKKDGTGRETIIARLNLRGGPLKPTGQYFDVAIIGKGFFRVEDPNTAEILYTRCGAFEPDENGQLVLAVDGVVRTIEPKIIVPEHLMEINVSTTGLISGKTSDGVEHVFGQLVLSWFRNPTRLQPEDDYCFSATAFSGPEINAQPGSAGLGTIQQKVLEQSNVNPEQLKERIEKVQMSRMLQQMLDSFIP
jgi:flagellar hook protein FlgE